MKKLYAFLLYLLLTVSAYATDTYYCDTGDDSTGAGTKASPWKTFTKAATTLNNGAAGDNIYLCEGGSFTHSTQTISTTCTANNPCTIGAYQPDDIAPEDIGVRPIIVVDAAAQNTGIYFGFGAAYTTIRDIEIKSSSWTSAYAPWGIFFYGENSYMTIDNMWFEDLYLAVHIYGTLLGDTEQNNILVKNSHFENMRSVGILGTGAYYKNFNNTYNLNGSNSGGRPLYNGGGTVDNGGDPDRSHDLLISGNVLTNSAPSDIGNGAYAGSWAEGTYGCNRTVFGGHGIITNFMIKNNIIIEDKNTVLGGCWGFVIDTAWPEPDEDFTNLIMQNNENYYAGNLNYGCSNCDGVIFRENIAYNVNGGTAIMAANRTEDTSHPTETMYAYYNLVVFDRLNTGSNIYGIRGVPDVAAEVISDIQWNVVIFSDTSAFNNCTSTDSGSTVQNNFCFQIDGSGNFTVSTNYATN